MITALGALRITDPARWEATIRRAMYDAGGRRHEAAAALGVSVRVLSRWLSELPDVERAPGGRPVGTTLRRYEVHFSGWHPFVVVRAASAEGARKVAERRNPGLVVKKVVEL